MVERLLKNYKNKTDEEQSFWDRIFHKFKISSISADLKKFYMKSFNEFLSEIEKTTQVTLTPTEEEEWSMYFKTKTDTIIKIDKIITEDENKLNNLIYKLYHFKESEISLLEKIPT